MNRLLRSRISTHAFDRWATWLVGFFLLAVVTTLVLKALPWLGLAISTVLVFGVAAAWLVIGRLFPRRGEVE